MGGEDACHGALSAVTRRGALESSSSWMPSRPSARRLRSIGFASGVESLTMSSFPWARWELEELAVSCGEDTKLLVEG